MWRAHGCSKAEKLKLKGEINHDLIILDPFAGSGGDSEIKTKKRKVIKITFNGSLLNKILFTNWQLCKTINSSKAGMWLLYLFILFNTVGLMNTDTDKLITV